MELNTKEFDRVLNEFLSVWPASRIATMTIEEYADLSNHNSFCYWLEYGSKYLGAIGGISLQKFELWKPTKDTVDFKDNRFSYDGTYAWSTKKGETSAEAFTRIKPLITQIINLSQTQNWQAIDNIPFHAIGKWKIAFLYSNRQLLPVYSKRALRAIAKGLGKEFHPHTPISQLQLYILQHKLPNEEIDDFAHRVYTQFAEKKPSENFYIFGSKYSDDYGNDTASVINDFIKDKSVAIGFLAGIDFSSYMGASADAVSKFVNENWHEKKPAWHKIQRYFRLLSQIKEGDIIAVKSHGAHNSLTIIAHAVVVERNGKVYEHRQNRLGHHINVEFIETGMYKHLGLTYAETIHQINPNHKNFSPVFGWYKNTDTTIIDDSGDSFEDEKTNQGYGFDEDYNIKGEEPLERGAIANVIVNREHNFIQNRFIQYLKATYTQNNCTGEKRWIDAIMETEKELFIYEIKPFERVYTCIREGIGQLLDYSHKLKTTKQKHIIIVGKNQPDSTDLEFINSLQTNLRIPFKYLAFDINNQKHKEY